MGNHSNQSMKVMDRIELWMTTGWQTTREAQRPRGEKISLKKAKSDREWHSIFSPCWWWIKKVLIKYVLNTPISTINHGDFIAVLYQFQVSKIQFSTMGVVLWLEWSAHQPQFCGTTLQKITLFGNYSLEVCSWWGKNYHGKENMMRLWQEYECARQ